MEGERIAKSMTIYVEKYRALLKRRSHKSGGGESGGVDGGGGGGSSQQQLEVEGEERKKSVEVVKKVAKILLNGMFLNLE